MFGVFNFGKPLKVIFYTYFWHKSKRQKLNAGKWCFLYPHFTPERCLS